MVKKERLVNEYNKLRHKETCLYNKALSLPIDSDEFRNTVKKLNSTLSKKFHIGNKIKKIDMNEKGHKKQATAETIKVDCRECGNSYSLSVNPKDFADWKNGKYIQDAMPYLTPAQRELLMSGICGKCWHKMFG